MKVRLKTQSAGPNGNFAPGIHDLPEAFARQLVEGGYAEALDGEAGPPKPPPVPVIETAAVAPAETAVIQQPQPRKPPEPPFITKALRPRGVRQNEKKGR